MSDLSQVTPIHLTSYSRFTPGPALGRVGGSAAQGSATWVANDAIYIPLTLPFPYPVQRVMWCNGSTLTSSHADVGVYTVSGTRIFSCGSTVMSGASTVQHAAFGSDVLLDPGEYFLAFWCDNTTARVTGMTAPGVNPCILAGCLTQNIAGGLPATATFAAFSTNVYPFFGLTRSPSGF